MPFEPGYTSAVTASDDTTVTVLLGNGDYAYGFMTLMRYLSLGYGGWRGGVRYIYDLPPKCCALNGISVTRCATCSNENKSTTISVPAGGRSKRATGQIMAAYDESSGQDGEIIARQEINPVVGFEVPYYSPMRFSPCRQITNFRTTENTGQPSFKVKFNGSSADQGLQMIKTHVAAAEDFSLFFFLGPPPLYYEVIPPLS